MDFWYDVRRRFRHAVVPFLFACAAGYFGYHVVEGDRGLIAWRDIKQRVVVARQTLALARAERETLERWVRLMNPGSLDADMLEEQARLTLNYGHADDIIILDPKRRK